MMTTAERITEALETMGALNVEEAREVLDDINPTTVGVTLSKMTSRGELVRKSDGKYYLGSASNREDAPGAAPPLPKPKPPAAPPAAKAAQTIAAARVEKKPPALAGFSDLVGETKRPICETKPPIAETKAPEIAAAELADETFGAAFDVAEQQAWSNVAGERVPANIHVQETDAEEITMTEPAPISPSTVHVNIYDDRIEVSREKREEKPAPPILIDVTLELPRAMCVFHGELSAVLPLLTFLQGYRAHA